MLPHCMQVSATHPEEGGLVILQHSNEPDMEHRAPLAPPKHLSHLLCRQAQAGQSHTQCRCIHSQGAHVS